jgi:hypothetical protein
VRCSTYKIIAIVLFALSVNVCSATEQADKEPISLCAKIDTGAITDVFDGSNVKYSKDYSYLLFTSDANGTNYTDGDDRLTIDGHVYISNDSVLQLKILTIASMKDGKPNDEVIYLSKGNKTTGGIFYNNTPSGNNGKENIVYIGVAGDVYHLTISTAKDKECLNHFPKKILDVLSTE